MDVWANVAILLMYRSHDMRQCGHFPQVDGGQRDPQGLGRHNNNYVNCSTSKSSFQIDNGYSPRTPIDLVPLPPHMCVFEPAKNFAKHIHDLHAEIR